MLQGWSPFDISCQGPWVDSQVAPGGSDITQPADLDSAGRPCIDRRVSLTDERG